MSSLVRLVRLQTFTARESWSRPAGQQEWVRDTVSAPDLGSQFNTWWESVGRPHIFSHSGPHVTVVKDNPDRRVTIASLSVLYALAVEGADDPQLQR